MPFDFKSLRFQAISRSLFAPVPLQVAFDKLKFVQADPIRFPARAQDLILRHRVDNYRSGDLEQQYTSLDIEEDFLYAHGFIKREIWQLLHPRSKIKLTKLDQQVLEMIRQLGETHPKDLGLHFNQKRVRNWWGGQSQATKMALDRLHYYGLLRIIRRQNGIRIYQTFIAEALPLTVNERLRQLIMTVINILTPITHQTLTQSLHRLRRHFGETRSFVNDLLTTGELKQQKIDGLIYLWPAEKIVESEIPRSVKFLTPFDPVVWDRPRFEHLWGWPYRFEAYTPPAKRIRGYYAMPLLWGDDVVGWVNINVNERKLNVETGFVNKRPQGRLFKSELEVEVERLKAFLMLKD